MTLKGSCMQQVHLSTPVGTLIVTFGGTGSVRLVDWIPMILPARSDESQRDWSGIHPLAAELMSGLQRYFLTGEPLDSGRIFSDLIDRSGRPEGWTDFQREVYRAVTTIPHGETRTYAWLARRIGRPQAARAVGQALRRNQHLIVIPCHRVVGAMDLGGFMGVARGVGQRAGQNEPELGLKERLLDWENSWRSPAFSFFGRSA